MASASCLSVALLVGLFVALGIGHCAAKLCRAYLYQRAKVPEPSVRVKAVPSWIVGVAERSLFMFLAIAALMNTPPRILDLITPALVWIGLKMAIHWQTTMAIATKKEQRAGIPAARAQAAILAGLVSLLVAMLGGYVFVTIVRTC